MEQRWVHRFEIKPGRWVYHPTDEAKTRGLEIKALVGQSWQPPSYFFHLRAGGHLAALRHHTDGRFFFRADIENFFGCVTRSKVTRSLVNYFGYRDARSIALDSTVRPTGMQQAHLPYGFVQSPVLASLALHRSALGSVIHRMAQRTRDLRVSVYMDDIIVSGNCEETLCAALLELLAAGHRSGFPFSTQKVEGPGASVTAFNIRLSQGPLEVIPARLQQFQDAILDSENELEKQGIFRYIESVNPLQAEALSVSVALLV